METAAESAAARARTAAALRAYKEKAGLIVSDEELAQAKETLDRGLAVFERGDFQTAAEIFQEVETYVHRQTDVGGQALLQRAIALDSLGRGADARTLYAALQRHPNAYVARTAKRLSFGFQAMKVTLTR